MNKVLGRRGSIFKNSKLVLLLEINGTYLKPEITQLLIKDFKLDADFFPPKLIPILQLLDVAISFSLQALLRNLWA
jgi:hypothetical protein